MGKIIYDFSFKYLFLNEAVRRHFISDALGIPLEEIRSVRLANTFLWKRPRRQKQGILDVVVELNNDSKVNIELQIEVLSYWDKRSLFYLSKLFTEGLLSGQKYEKLKSASASGFSALIWISVRNTTRCTDYGMRRDMSFRTCWKSMLSS